MSMLPSIRRSGATWDLTAGPCFLTLLLWIAVASGVPAAGAADDDTSTDAINVRVTYDVQRLPALIVTPDRVALGLDESGYVRWTFDEGPGQLAATFGVEFDPGAPFAHAAHTVGADEECLIGPLTADATIGAYTYHVSIIDEAGQTIAGETATLELVTSRGIPRIYLLIALLVAALLLIAAYTEQSLTRTYEPAAH